MAQLSLIVFTEMYCAVVDVLSLDLNNLKKLITGEACSLHKVPNSKKESFMNISTKNNLKKKRKDLPVWGGKKTIYSEHGIVKPHHPTYFQ